MRTQPIPARTQLLAVAWLRWRIFVNSTFRRRPKRQATGGRPCVRDPVAAYRVAIYRADGDRSHCGQRIFGVGRQSPSISRRTCCTAARGRYAAVAVREHQRREHCRRRFQLRSVVADPLSAALRALPGFADDARLADAKHDRGLSGAAGGGRRNRYSQTRAGVAGSDCARRLTR